MELGLRETNELGWVVSLEGKQMVIASYWRVSNSHIKNGSRDKKYRVAVGGAIGSCQLESQVDSRTRVANVSR